MGGIAAQTLVELRHEGIAQHAILGAHGIRQRKTRRVLAERRQLARRKERVVHGFREAKPHQIAAQLLLRAERRIVKRRDGRCGRHRIGNVVETVETRDLFDEIRFEREVPPPARNRECGVSFGCGDLLQSQRFKDLHHAIVRNVDADQTARPRERQRNRRVVGKAARHALIRKSLAAVGVHNAFRDNRAAVLLQKMHGTAAGEVGEILVHATDVAVARLRRKLQLRG